MSVLQVSGIALDLASVAELASSRAGLSAGEVLVQEGTQADAVFVVLDGELDIRVGANGHLVGTASRGTLVGETAVLAGGTRTATVTAQGEAEVLQFDRPAFEALLDAYPQLAERVTEEAVHRLDRRHLIDFLERVLGRGDPDVLRDVEDSLEWLRVPAGTPLYEQGDPASAGYFVISGRFRLQHESADGRAEHLQEVVRDEMVGEAGLIGSGRREATARAIRDSIVVRIDTESFFDLVNRHPKVLLPVVTNLAARSRVAGHARRERTIALLVAGELDRRLFSSRLVDAMAEHGSTAHMWSARADGLLGRPGVSQVGVGEPGDVRVAQLLHELEMDHTYLLCEVDPHPSEWTRRITRQADRLVAILQSRPSDSDLASVETFFRDAPPDSERLLVVMNPPDAARPAGTSALMQRIHATEALNVRTGANGDMHRLARMLAGTGNGLVLGGGGARGFAHIGVYRALRELGVPVDLVGGSSIGAPLGAAIAVGLVDPRLTNTVEEHFSDVLDYTVPVVALVKGERIARSIEKNFGGWDFEDTWLPFFCLSTNLTRGSELIHDRGPLTPAVRASVAIPGVIPPVPWGEDLLVDGGVLNNLPVDVMRRRNPSGTVVAVDVAPPMGPRSKGDAGLSVSGWQALRSKFSKNAPQFPGMAAVLLRTMITGSVRGRQESLERGDADLLLDLDLRGISLLEFDSVRKVADAGYEAAMPRLEAWLGERERV